MLADRLHEEFPQYHPQFARDLIHGDLYGDVTVTTAVSYNTQTWNIEDPHDNTKTFDYDYAAGASRFFILNLETPDFSPSSVLTLEAEGGGLPTIEVFKYHGSNSTLLGSGEGVNIDHLDQLQADGQHLLVMVVNSFLGNHYTDDSNIVLHANIQENPVFRAGKVWVSGLGTMRVHETSTSGLDTTYTVEGRTCQFDGSLYLDPVAGSTTGTTFTAYYDSLVVEENLHKSGTISISVDDADTPTMVTSFNLDATEVSPYTGEAERTKTYNITGHGVPLYDSTAGIIRFRIPEGTTDSYIDQVEYVEKDIFGTTKEYTLLDLDLQFLSIELDR